MLVRRSWNVADQKQMWTEQPKGKNKKPVNKDRFISKMFLRCVYMRIPIAYLADNTSVAAATRSSSVSSIVHCLSD